MTVSYENTAEDAFAWDYYHQTQTRAGRWLRFRSCCVWGLIMALIVVASNNLKDILQGRDLESLFLQIASALAAFVFFFVWSVLNFKGRLKGDVQARIKKDKQSLFLGTKEAGLLPEGLRIAWDGGYAVRNWSTLKEFSQTETHLVFFYSDVNFILIPKRAFDEAHLQNFINETERLRAGANPAASVGASAVVANMGSAPWWRNRSSVDTEDDKVLLRQRQP